MAENDVALMESEPKITTAADVPINCLQLLFDEE
jgi:hypothetical protein